MISKAQLAALQSTSYNSPVGESLVDIRTVRVDRTLSRDERTLRYLDAVRNPYLFRVDDTVVRVRYGEGGQTLQASIARVLAQQ